MSTTPKAYLYRLYPSEEQAHAVQQHVSRAGGVVTQAEMWVMMGVV
jgi:hypothetical protein